MIGRSRKVAYSLSLLLVSATVLSLNSPNFSWLLAGGVATPGHENLECESCHTPAPGTHRQQIQANVQHWLGNREKAASFVHDYVTSESCADCHQRSADPHPIHRFLEPKFTDARVSQSVHQCTGCHLEHQGRRVTVGADVCALCHGDTVVANDQIEPPHAVLIEEEQWSTCLRCHDFHDNHNYAPPRSLLEGLKDEQVEAHLNNGNSGYGETVHRASKERSE